MSTSVELIACSQVTSLPVYAAMRPMIASIVLFATCSASLSLMSFMIAVCRSMCSCVYGSVCLPDDFHAFAPLSSQ